MLINPYPDQEGNKLMFPWNKLMFPSEWREFPSAPCLAGKTTWWQLASRCCWNRARPWRASELVPFLVGLRIYHHSSILYWILYATKIMISYGIRLKAHRLTPCKWTKLPYFSIDNAHLMYNAHPKLFRHSFWCIDNAHGVFSDR